MASGGCRDEISIYVTCQVLKEEVITSIEYSRKLSFGVREI